MKTSGLILLIILSPPIWGQDQSSDDEPTATHQAEFPEVPQPPQRPFEFQVPLYQDYDSLEELKDWAHNTSRIWGWTNTIEFAGREVHYSVRTFTSGVATEELIFFTLDHRGKIAPFLAIPVKNREMKVKVEGGKMVVSAFIESELTPILSFSSAMLPYLSDKSQAQQGGADQPATAPESMPENNSKPQSDSKVRLQ